MEVFTFVYMGGSFSRIDVILIGAEAGRHASQADLLEHFDCRKATCRYESDKQRLLAVIEAAFGEFESFNRIVHLLLSDSSPAMRKTTRHASDGPSSRRNSWLHLFQRHPGRGSRSPSRAPHSSSPQNSSRRSVTTPISPRSRTRAHLPHARGLRGPAIPSSSTMAVGWSAENEVNTSVA